MHLVIPSNKLMALYTSFLSMLILAHFFPLQEKMQWFSCCTEFAMPSAKCNNRSLFKIWHWREYIHENKSIPKIFKK